MTDIFDAVSTGNLVRLKYFHEKRSFMYDSLCNIAAETGHINCLKYLHENGYFWDKMTCWHAALNGHIECLKYAHENECAWDINRCGYAAKYSHLPSPQYAHKNGHLECVKYLYEMDVHVIKSLYLLLFKRFLFQSGVLLLKVVRLSSIGWNVVRKLLVQKTDELVLKTRNHLKMIVIV
jgi:hypothetical protein